MDPVNSEQSDGKGCGDPNESSSSSNKGSSTNNSDNNGSVHNFGQTSQNAIEVKNLFAPSEQDSPLHILVALCDDLLYDVFMRLHYLDLLNVAKVCVRFQIQAQAAFSSKYKNLELSNEECDQYKMESVVSEFGPFIQSLRVDASIYATDVGLFRAIIQNCSPKLKVLRLSNVNIQVDSPSGEFCLPFPELEELGLDWCGGNYSLVHLIDGCPELTKIDIFWSQMQGVNDMISRKFKRLERLYLYVVDVSDAALEHFITSNPGLIDLRISTFSELHTSRAIRLFGQNMLVLQELYFNAQIKNLDQFQSDVQHIGNLRSLKSLYLNFNDLDVAPLANVLVTNNLPIEEFGIEDTDVDDNAIEWISRLKQINVLKFHRMNLTNENLITLAKNLPELQKLYSTGTDWISEFAGIIQMIRHANKLSYFRMDYYHDTAIELDDYNAMLEAIRSRPEKIGLRIEYSGYIKINVPENILQENREILSIDRGW